MSYSSRSLASPWSYPSRRHSGYVTVPVQEEIVAKKNSNLTQFEAASEPSRFPTPSEYPSGVLKARSVIRKIKKFAADDGISFKKSPFWIAGGSLASLITSQPVNDYDIFTSHPKKVKDVFDRMCALYPDNWVKGHTTTSFTNYYLDGEQVQLITRFNPASMEATIRMFDFSVVCAAFDGEKFVCHDRYYMDLAAKRLVKAWPDDVFPFPLNTVERMNKYAGKGYSTCPVMVRSLLKQINEMEIDWENPSEDLLTFYPDGTFRFTGVD